jgi:hypothetical protein
VVERLREQRADEILASREPARPAPMAGRRHPGPVFVTHPEPRAAAVVARLRAAGLDAHALPAFGLESIACEALADAAARLATTTRS